LLTNEFNAAFRFGEGQDAAHPGIPSEESGDPRTGRSARGLTVSSEDEGNIGPRRGQRLPLSSAYWAKGKYEPEFEKGFRKMVGKLAGKMTGTLAGIKRIITTDTPITDADKRGLATLLEFELTNLTPNHEWFRDWSGNPSDPRVNTSMNGLSRDKRWVLPLLTPLVGGLINIALEGISGYLQRRRARAMEKALNKIHMEKHLRIVENQVQQYKDDLLLYGRYSLETLDNIIDTMNHLAIQVDKYESLFEGIDEEWPHLFATGDHGPPKLANMLQLASLKTIAIHQGVYEPLIESLKTLLVAASKLSRGLIPPEIFTPVKLEGILQVAQQTIDRDYPRYELAISELTHYYDLKLVTYSVDRSTRELVITFPIFMKLKTSEALTLYELETVHVPVLDMNSEANSYTRVVFAKP
jgi:hypothetical protein